MSSPIRSDSRSGPIGCAHPSTMPRSMSSREAKPDSYMRTADSRYGISSALTTKPARSCESMHCLPSVSSANSRARVGRLVRGHDRVHDLHERQHRHRVEEVQPDHLVRLRRAGAELHDRHRRGVRGEELRVGQQLVEPLEQIALGVLVLDDRLDRGVGALDVVERRSRTRAAPARRRGPPPRRGRPARRGRATSRSPRVTSRHGPDRPRSRSRRRPSGRTPPRSPNP